METLSVYRAAVRKVLEAYAAYAYGASADNIQAELIFDEAQDHYEVMRFGWEGPRRVHGAVLHVDIRDGKVWIQHDGTEDSIAEELVAAGVPRDKIVLAYKSPDLRLLTDHAIA